MFVDREDAGRKLATLLARFKHENACVLALPRGGVPVAFEVARALGLPLDLVLVRKIGAPFQPELAIGAIVDGSKPELVVNEEIAAMLDLPEGYLAEQGAEELKEIERRRKLYLGGRPRIGITGKTVLLIDDGIATGATIRAALRATRRAGPGRIVLAVPVAPTATAKALRTEADEVVVLEEHEHLDAIGLYYRNFAQVTDEAVRDLMNRSTTRAAVVPPQCHA
jgi:putative phosphoribosyl transferase